MRFSRIKLNGMGPFRGPVEVDLDALPGALVAVTGPNGAGKSSLLELLAGGLYRRCPTRGSLADLATARDSSVEVEVVNGARYTVTQLIDSVSGKGETLITNGDGRPVIDSAKVRDGDAWIRSHLLPEDVVLSTIFAAQQSGGFLDMKPGDRKGVLLKILGIEHLEEMAELARERARDAKARLATADARLADERGRNPHTFQQLHEAFREASVSYDQAFTESQAARLALDEATAAAVDVGEALRSWQRRTAEAADLRRRTAELAGKIVDLEKRIANNRAVRDRAAEIRAAVAEDATQAEVERDARAEVERLRAEERRLVELEQHHAGLAARAASDATMAARRIDGARQSLADRERIAAAVDGLPALREALAAAEGALAEAERQLEAARGQRIAGAEQRIEGLRDGLEEIGAGCTNPEAVAFEALRADDGLVEAARQAPALVRQAEEHRTRAAQLVDADRRRVADAERLAARQGEMAAVEGVIATAEAERDAAAEREAAAAAAVAAARLEAGGLGSARDIAERCLGEAVAKRAALAPVAKLAEPLAQAEARLAELEPQIGDVTAERARVTEQLDAYADLGAAPAAPDVEAARRRATAADAKAREAHAALALAEQRVTDATASAARAAVLEAERRAIETELADWTRLAADLGRTGLQALEIDAAGPELTELVNDLLRNAFGPRFTVSIETTKTGADGRELEGCEVRVLDTERGREGAAETFSGGERVVIGEAVALALSTLACRRAGIERPTIVRDESGAALDPVNGWAYVAMLRRAADLIGADRVLYVSHTPELQELADVRLHIEGGRIEVR